jgi:hypothetical protein
MGPDGVSDSLADDSVSPIRKQWARRYEYGFRAGRGPCRAAQSGNVTDEAIQGKGRCT